MAGGEKTAENFISGILRGDLLALSDFLGSGYVLLVCAILVFVLIAAVVVSLIVNDNKSPKTAQENPASDSYPLGKKEEEKAGGIRKTPLRRERDAEKFLRELSKLCGEPLETVLQPLGHPKIRSGIGSDASVDLAGDFGNGEDVAGVCAGGVFGEQVDGDPGAADVEGTDGHDRVLQRVHGPIQRNDAAGKDVRSELQQGYLHHGAGRNEHSACGVLFCGVFVFNGAAGCGREIPGRSDG